MTSILLMFAAAGFVTAVLLVEPAFGQGDTGTCPPNEVPSNCVVPCNDCITKGKCNFLVCNKGCDCIKGYFRNKLGVCIPETACPQGVPSAGSCTDENEEYSDCGSACAKTCANMNKDIMCIQACVAGCFCKEGFVRNDKGICVKPQECGNPKCTGQNEEYSDCGTACPKTCENLNESGACIAVCKEGCFCTSGFVRNAKGLCVKPEECHYRACRYNEEYKCGTKCPKTCKTLDVMFKCVAGCDLGCFCKDGFVRNEEGGYCIPTSYCPERKCVGLNEEYSDCGTACPKTCENLDENSACIEVCERGCFCKPGFVRNNKGVCVRPNECHRKCPENQEWSCITICKGCAFYKSATACNEIWCNPGCECKDGYRRNSNNVCIPEEQCPLPVF